MEHNVINEKMIPLMHLTIMGETDNMESLASSFDLLLPVQVSKLPQKLVKSSAKMPYTPCRNSLLLCRLSCEIKRRLWQCERSGQPDIAKGSTLKRIRGLDPMAILRSEPYPLEKAKCVASFERIVHWDPAHVVVI